MMKNSEAPKERLTHYAGTLLSLLFFAAVLFLFPGSGFCRTVYAEKLSGTKYFASTLKSHENKLEFSNDVTIVMDQDLQKTSLTGYDITITGSKTLTLSGTGAKIICGCLKIEDGAVLSTAVHENTGSPDYAIVIQKLALSNASLLVNNEDGGGVYSTEDIIVNNGTVQITATSRAALFTNFENAATEIKNSVLDLKTIDDNAIQSGYIRISNTSGSVYSHNWNGMEARQELAIAGSALTVQGNHAAFVSSNGMITLAGDMYVRSPEHTKLAAASVQIGTKTRNYHCVLCNADGTPVKTAVTAKRDLSHALCVIAPVPEQVCTGSALTPALNISWDGTPLKEGTDYTVTYQNNVNNGTASAVISGKGNYSGTRTVIFQIIGLPAGSKAKVAGQTYKVLDDKTVAFIKAKNKKSVTVPANVTIKDRIYAVTEINAKAFKGAKIRTVTIGKNVTRIKANAFKGSIAEKLILKTKLLKKKKVKNALKGSHISTVQVKVGKKSVNKKIRKAYKKFFTAKVLGRKVLLK